MNQTNRKIRFWQRIELYAEYSLLGGLALTFLVLYRHTFFPVWLFLPIFAFVGGTIFMGIYAHRKIEKLKFQKQIRRIPDEP